MYLDGERKVKEKIFRPYILSSFSGIMASFTHIGQVDIWDESSEFWSSVIIRGERKIEGGEYPEREIFVLGPPSLLPHATTLLNAVSFANYPTLIISAIHNIAHRTAVLYQFPARVLSDWVFVIAEPFKVFLYCITCEFQADRNQFVLVFLDQDQSIGQ